MTVKSLKVCIERCIGEHYKYTVLVIIIYGLVLYCPSPRLCCVEPQHSIPPPTHESVSKLSEPHAAKPFT